VRQIIRYVGKRRGDGVQDLSIFTVYE